MAVKVAINGFGRIGRLAFRQMFEVTVITSLDVIVSFPTLQVAVTK